MDPAFVTLRFEPVPLTVRLRRGVPKLVLAIVLIALFPVARDRGAVLLGPGDGSLAFDRLIAGGIIGFPLLCIAFAAIVTVLKPGRGCTVTFSERGLHEHGAPVERVHPWSFVATAIENDVGLELRCGYGMGRSVTTRIPPDLLLPRSVPEYERVRSLLAAHAGARFRGAATR